jgi:fatty acid desaturase
LYNTALVKFIVMIIFTFLLNILCQRGLTVISWFIVFIPFITMTIITTLLLITFGLSPFSGKIDNTNNAMQSSNMQSSINRPQKKNAHTEQPKREKHEKFYN